MTGWNLPPGCTDRMVDEAFGVRRDPSELQENVRNLLVRACISEQAIQIILETIEEEEDAMREPDPDDERDARADYEFERDR